MCGILGVYVNTPKADICQNLIKIFDNQKNRGIDGVGFGLRDDKRFFRLRGKNAVTFINSMPSLVMELKPFTSLILHHRYPSHGGGGQIIECNHPFMNESRDTMLIHNGVISNYDKLYNVLQLNHKFESELTTYTKEGKIARKEIVDSEVILHLLESNEYDNIKDIKGSFAIAMLKELLDGIILYRENNPIWVYDYDGNTYFSSVLPKLDVTNKVELQEGWIYTLNATGLHKIKQIKEVAPSYSFNFNDWRDKSTPTKTTKKFTPYDWEEYDFKNGRWKD